MISSFWRHSLARNLARMLALSSGATTIWLAPDGSVTASENQAIGASLRGPTDGRTGVNAIHRSLWNPLVIAKLLIRPASIFYRSAMYGHEIFRSEVTLSANCPSRFMFAPVLSLTEPNSSRPFVRIVHWTESALTIDVVIILPANKAIDIMIIQHCSGSAFNEIDIQMHFMLKKSKRHERYGYKSTPNAYEVTSLWKVGNVYYWLLLLRPQQRWRNIVMANEHVSVSVCLSVCPRAYLPNNTHDLYQIFHACCLSPWFGPPPAGWSNSKGKGQFYGFSSPLKMHWAVNRHEFCYEGPIWLKFTSLP